MSSFNDFRATQKNEAEKLYEYGKSLYELHRYADAESTLRQFLARSPQDWYGHFFLASSLLAQSTSKPEKARDGLNEAKKVVTLRPDTSAGYFLVAWAQLCLRRYNDVLAAVHEGMRIDPEEAWGYSLAAQAHLAKSEWDKALHAAATGLKFEPQHVTLTNLRAEALMMLDRKDEARIAMQDALALDPTSHHAHINRGWLALYENNPLEALGHFREAMRLDPTSQSARAGFVQSLQARNPLYRLMLRYFLWTSRLSQGEFWAFIILLSGVNRTLRLATRMFPPLALITIPYFILYSIFTFFTWIADPFSDLLLWLSPTGRLVLSKDEKTSAAGCGSTGLLFLLNVGATIAALFLYPGQFMPLWIFLLGSLLTFGMLIPISGIFKVSPKARKRRATLITLAALMGSCALCGWSGSFGLAPWHAIPVGLFLVGWLFYPLIANIVISLGD